MLSLVGGAAGVLLGIGVGATPRRSGGGGRDPLWPPMGEGLSGEGGGLRGSPKGGQRGSRPPRTCFLPLRLFFSPATMPGVTPAVCDPQALTFYV